MKIYAVAALALFFVMAPTLAQQVPVGGQFLVNTYTTNYQEKPSVAVAADGDFVVVWQSFGSDDGDTASTSVQGQRYASNGDPLGGQFQINTYTTNSQLRPSVAVGADGNFVVVWHSNGSDNGDTSSWSVQGQRYASNGDPLGGQFLVNTYTTSSQYDPSVAVGADGNFVVVWHSYGSDNGDASNYSVQGQRYASNGDPLGGQFLINTYTTNGQVRPSVAVDADGDFVVVWDGKRSDSGDTSNYSVQGQRYASNGDPLGGQFLVNTYTTSYQLFSSIGMDPNGDFVVVWSSFGSDSSDTSSYSVQGQRYASSGDALGTQFQVNTYTINYQYRPAVAVAANGDFAVVWESKGSDNGDTSYWSVQGQRYASNGDPLGGQFLVNTYTTNNQLHPSVAVDPKGGFVVVWDSNGSDNGDTSSYSIQGQRFHVPIAIFFDGFESGATTAWSSTVGGSP